MAQDLFFKLFFSAHSIIDCPAKNDKDKKVPWTSDIVVSPQNNNTEVTMGRTKLIMKTRCRHTHFKWEERLLLQYHHNGSNGYEKITSPTLLGQLLSKSGRTIRRELKRGMVVHLDSELRHINEYNAEYAQNDADSRNSSKGPSIKLGNDWELGNSISTLIKEEHYSPYVSAK